MSNSIAIFRRNTSTGALSQATDRTGCIAAEPTPRCASARALVGPDVVAVSPDGRNVYIGSFAASAVAVFPGNNEYVTSTLTNSVANVSRNATTGELQQDAGTTGCGIYVLATACTLGRTLVNPEGVAVSPDGASVYTAAIGAGAIDVFDRTAATGGLMEKPRRVGCLVSHPTVGCTLTQALLGASSVVVSPDGRNVYATAFASNAVDVFTRQTKR
jgi:DNA-binding beta-propeller fold protein YncE